MSSIRAAFESICSEIENQSEAIKMKVFNVNQVWKGDSQKSFNEAHNEAYHKAKNTKSKIQSMQSLVRSLETSIQSADRDIAAKKAAEALARNTRRR